MCIWDRGTFSDRLRLRFGAGVLDSSGSGTSNVELGASVSIHRRFEHPLNRSL